MVKEVPSDKPAGIVVDQNPAEGSSRALGSPVEIDVSNGKTPVSRVPDVIGFTEKAAVAALKAAGFNVTILYQPVNSKKDDGIVLDQHPRGGAKRPQGSNVTIIVGQLIGPP